MFAHGEHLFAGLVLLVLVGASSTICFLIGLAFYLTDGSNKRRLSGVAILWFVTVLLSVAVAVRADRFLK